MSETESKESTIKKVYSNPITGYGSVRDTYQQANKINPGIRYVDVKEYLDKQQHRQTRFKYKGSNSFVSPHALFEIEADLIDMTKAAEQNNGYRYALVAIDNFTKFAYAVPMKSKQPHDVTTSFNEVLNKIGVPKQLYSDREGSFESKEFIRLLNQHNIKHIISNTGAHSIERFNRTLKHNTMLRLDAMNLDRFKWVDQLKPIIDKYNNTIHNTTEMTPNQAKKHGNQLMVSYNIWAKAKRNRQYPEISLGDDVRVKTIKDSKTKGYDPKFSKEVYQVTFIKDNSYLVNDGKKKRTFVMNC